MGTTAVRKLCRLHKSPDMSLQAWQTTDRHTIGTAAFRIRDLEFGENGLGPVALQREGLLAPELPPELPDDRPAHELRQHISAGSSTDFGVKADELMTLLDELVEQPGSKVVVFSQRVRMHELLLRRLEKKASTMCGSTVRARCS
jgi:hypothetical protein